MLHAPFLNLILVSVNLSFISLFINLVLELLPVVHMLHKFRRGLEVLNQGLFIHELFDINNDEDEILLTSVKSQIEQEEVFRDIGLLGILNGV